MKSTTRHSDIHAPLLFEIEAISQLRLLENGDWQALGDDPQFRLTLPQGHAAGFFRMTAVLAGDEVHAPCVYLDFGDGWSESHRVDLLKHGEDWSALVVLPASTAPARFDPSDRAGRFRLHEVRLQQIDHGEAILLLLNELAEREPKESAALLRESYLHMLGHGPFATMEWLLHRRAGKHENPGALSYAEWASRFDSLDPADHEQLRRVVWSLPSRPLISVIMPVYNSPEAYLRECLDSVLAQIYPDWELCIADDASPQPHVRRVLEEYVRRDSRVRYVSRPSNGHISAASNSALELARGQFVALLDHDDLLPVHALLAVADAVIRHPDARMLYSDEDKIDAFGRRFDPYLKPDWNPELFLSQNYFSHLGVYETALVREVGGFRIGLEGSQDYDLALRCVARIKPDQVVHIPHVLYHWRAIEGSTALALGEKDYAVEAGRKALHEHLERIGRSAAVEPTAGGYRARYRIPSSPPKVSLIIPTRDRVDLLRCCVDSILEKTSYPNYEIVIVDNQSAEVATKDYFAGLAGHARVRVLAYDAPFNYSRMNNVAVSQVDGELIGLLNNDVEVIEPEWLGEMVSHAIRPDVGAVGAMLYYPDDTIQHAGVILGIHGVAGHIYSGKPRGTHGQMGRARLVQNLSAVTAACMLVRRPSFIEAGGLDERLQVAFNDIDFCLKLLELGYRNVWTPFAELYHHESASRGYEDTPEKQARFQSEIDHMYRRWSNCLALDPAYHPGLSLAGEAFLPAQAPRHTLGEWVEEVTSH